MGGRRSTIQLAFWLQVELLLSGRGCSRLACRESTLNVKGRSLFGTPLSRNHLTAITAPLRELANASATRLQLKPHPESRLSEHCRGVPSARCREYHPIRSKGLNASIRWISQKESLTMAENSFSVIA